MGFCKKAGVVALIVSLLVSLNISPIMAEGMYWPAEPEIYSESAILMDADTGVILYDKNMDQTMYPASVTKIMTCLLGLENGNLSDEVTMSEEAVYYAQAGSSNLYTQVGEVFTLEQLLYGTMLKSANDMATQVGVYVGGNIEHFAEMMNTKAASLGCKNTHFVNACGMPADDHVTSAHDLALISREALKNNDFRKIVGTHAYEIPPTNMTSSSRIFSSHNPMLVDPEYAYPGIIGGKTGYTDAARSTLAIFASRDGLTFISVSLKAADANQAALDNTALQNFAFDNFQHLDMTAAYASEGGYALVPKGVTPDCVEVSEEVDVFGETTLTYTYDGRYVGSAVMTEEQADAYHAYLESITAPAENVDESEAEPAKVPAEKYVRKSNSTFKTVFFIVLGILVLLAGVMVALTVKAERERRRRRRRRQERIRRQQRREMRRREEDNT